jgi:hypothetical protein
MQLTNLLQKAYSRLGQTTTYRATGGSTTTIVNSAWQAAGLDDDTFNGGAIVVISTADGLAPVGELSYATAYDEGTTTLTFSPALTAAIESGDRVAFLRPLYPLDDMIEIVNDVLHEIGKIALTPDTSITTVDSQTEYTLPVALRRSRIFRAEYQANTGDADDNDWTEIQIDEVPGDAGEASSIRLPQLDAGRTVRLWYIDYHPRVDDFDDYIHESIPEELIVAYVVAYAREWYVGRTQSSDQTDIQLLNKALADLDVMKREHKVYKPVKQNRYLTYTEG